MSNIPSTPRERPPIDPTDLDIGPFHLEIVEPMKQLRVTVDDNETGISGELTWRSRVGALEEDHTTMSDGPRLILDMVRFIQFGTWEGSVTAGGVTTVVRHDETVGVRDRSWGIRPVGEAVPGRPASQSGSSAWLWAPIHFDDACRVVGYFQRPGGAIWRADGHSIPVLDPIPSTIDASHPGVLRIDPVGQRLDFHPGTRWVSRAEIDVIASGGERFVLELEPMRRFDMRGIGYMNPDWGHGHWKGTSAIGAEHWNFADISPMDPTHQHVHHAVRARIGDQVGVGIFEQIIFGPHTQFGFHDLLDGAVV